MKFSQLDYFLFVISCCFLFVLPLTNCVVPQKREDRSYPKCIQGPRSVRRDASTVL